MEVNSQEPPGLQEEGDQSLCHQQEAMVAHGERMAADQKPICETQAPKDCPLEVMVEDLEPKEGVQQLSRKMGAIGKCIALNAVLKEIEDKKAETICKLARDKMELTWDLQDL
jgi:hypothetical protein